jgi:hypothetical protein
METNKNARTLLTFEGVIPRKIQKELCYKYKQVYIFRIKLKKFRGWAFWTDKITARDVEYVGESYNHIFTPSTQTWKEWKKEYETRND